MSTPVGSFSYTYDAGDRLETIENYIDEDLNDDLSKQYLEKDL